MSDGNCIGCEEKILEEKPGTRARYILPTGISLLANKALEMMHAHSRGNDYKYDDYPIVKLSQAINDQNALFLTRATEEGTLGESGNLK